MRRACSGRHTVKTRDSKRMFYQKPKVLYRLKALRGMGGWVKPKVKTFRFYRVFDSNKASGFRAEGEGGLAGLSSRGR